MKRRDHKDQDQKPVQKQQKSVICAHDFHVALAPVRKQDAVFCQSPQLLCILVRRPAPYLHINDRISIFSGQLLKQLFRTEYGLCTWFFIKGMAADNARHRQLPYPASGKKRDPVSGIQ